MNELLQAAGPWTEWWCACLWARPSASEVSQSYSPGSWSERVASLSPRMACWVWRLAYLEIAGGPDLGEAALGSAVARELDRECRDPRRTGTDAGVRYRNAIAGCLRIWPGDECDHARTGGRDLTGGA